MNKCHNKSDGRFCSGKSMSPKKRMKIEDELRFISPKAYRATDQMTDSELGDFMDALKDRTLTKEYKLGVIEQASRVSEGRRTGRYPKRRK